MHVCKKCGCEFNDSMMNSWSGTVSINGNDPITLCGSCLFKVQSVLDKTDYAYARDMMTRTGYDKDIEPHDDKNYFVLSAYGNRVAVEFDENGEFVRITEAE